MEYKGLGWKKQPDDSRDLNINKSGILDILMPSKVLSYYLRRGIPNGHDLRPLLPFAYNQYSVNSCAANAVACLLDAHLIQVGLPPLTPSRLFIYYYARFIDGADVKKDDGTYLRTAMKSLARYGAPPEWAWEYIPFMFSVEPPMPVRYLAEKHQTLQYISLVDPDDVCDPDLLNQIRVQLHLGRPIAFGTPIYDSIHNITRNKYDIPYPAKTETSTGDHAMVIVGYDNNRKITNPTDGKSTYGAFLVRNSWGMLWGDCGYAWLSYDYLTSPTKRLMFDLWVLIDMEH